jgi:hypothetical protein
MFSTILCVFLLALALSVQTCYAKEYKIIDGKKVYGKTVEVDCNGPKCCSKAFKNAFGDDVEYTITGYYVTKVDQNGNSAVVTCTAFVEDK